MGFLEEVKKHWVVVLFTALTGMVSIFGSVLLRDIGAPFLERVLPTIPSTTFLAIIGLLLLVVIVLTTWIILLWKRINRRIPERELEFIEKEAVFFHQKSGKRFCPRCRNSGRDSILANRKGIWWCPSKDCSFRSHEIEAATGMDVQPPPAPRLVARMSWMDRWRS